MEMFLLKLKKNQFNIVFFFSYLFAQKPEYEGGSQFPARSKSINKHIDK
mgnify:CR=1 FL=1